MIDTNNWQNYNVITMKASIITIGNSKGIRIPKPLLRESGISKYVNITVKKGEIKIVPIMDDGGLNEFAKASEKSFAKDWLRPEEDEAWKVYQSAK